MTNFKFDDLENNKNDELKDIIINAAAQADKEIEEEYEKILLDNGTNNKEIENLQKNTTTQAKYLLVQLDHLRNVLRIKQERIRQLEEALKKSSFQTADMVQTEMKVGLSADEEFNVMHNRSYYIV